MSEEASKPLNYYLGQAYKARFLDQRGTDQVCTELAERMKASEALSAEVRKAHVQYASVNQPGGQPRCIISKAHAEFLAAALSKAQEE